MCERSWLGSQPSNEWTNNYLENEKCKCSLRVIKWERTVMGISQVNKCRWIPDSQSSVNVRF